MIKVLNKILSNNKRICYLKNFIIDKSVIEFKINNINIIKLIKIMFKKNCDYLKSDKQYCCYSNNIKS